ncbi:oligopeptide/dipeptide ABC transporter ATP-binding protein [Streptomyces sp. NPDC020780]|uniref:oligopeptide/dipeptide ABC transporter ATP-binding protein n=1 Tax=unclassified Streptomyces TaxID=2593676 RepID=UPI003795D4C1
MGDKRDAYGAPAHPDTQAPLSAVPLPDPVAEHHREHLALLGDPPSPAPPPSGCTFPRHPRAQESCRARRPAPAAVGPGARPAAETPSPTADS